MYGSAIISFLSIAFFYHTISTLLFFANFKLCTCCISCPLKKNSYSWLGDFLFSELSLVLWLSVLTLRGIFTDCSVNALTFEDLKLGGFLFLYYSLQIAITTRWEVHHTKQSIATLHNYGRGGPFSVECGYLVAK